MNQIKARKSKMSTGQPRALKKVTGIKTNALDVSNIKPITNTPGQEPETINGLTFEMAQKKVMGTKFKAINRFRQFTTVEFDYEDLTVEVDMAIFQAWKTWKPEESLFNTYATNMINWLVYRALENHNDVFRMNRKTKMNLHTRGESFKTLFEKKKTNDPEFNLAHELDGNNEFTREHFNKYVYHTSSKVFGVNVRNESSFNNQEGEAISILKNQPDIASKFNLEEMEMDFDLSKLDNTVKVVYDLLSEGYSIKEALEIAQTTPSRLKSLYIKSSKNLKRQKPAACEV